MPTTLEPNLDLWNQLFQTTQQAQRQANLGRIPGAEELEASSSADIYNLLNPPAVFGDVSRRAAEVGAGRGIPGSEAAFGAGLRMTDDERIRRIALGQQMLTAAYGRNPAAELPNIYQSIITPSQQADIDARNRQIAVQEEQNRLAREWQQWRINRLNEPSVTYSSPDDFWNRSASAGGRAGASRAGGDLSGADADSMARYGAAGGAAVANALAMGDNLGFVPAAGGYALPGGGYGEITSPSGAVTRYDYGTGASRPGGAMTDQDIIADLENSGLYDLADMWSSMISGESAPAQNQNTGWPEGMILPWQPEWESAMGYPEDLAFSPGEE